MNYGYFFKLDRDSMLKDGIVQFRYMPVTTRKGDVKYPIYLIVNRYSVEIYCHTFSEGSIHTHHKILSLSLSTDHDVKDNLTDTLKDCYTHFYSFKDQVEIDRTPFSNEFSSDSPQEPSKTSSSKIALRNIILDFIYDFENHSVFEHSPFYEEVEIFLKQNKLFNAILLKYLYRLRRNAAQGDSSIMDLDLYVKAERSWLDFLRTEGLSEVVYCSGWIKDVEIEYAEIVFRKDRQENINRFYSDSVSTSNETDEVLSLKQSTRWLIRRYAMISAVRTVIQNWAWRFKFTLWMKAVAIIFLFFIFRGLIAIIGDSSSLCDKAVYVITMSVLGMGIAIPILFIVGKSFFSILLPRLLASISAAWMIIVTTEELWKISYDVYLGNALYYIPFLLFTMFYLYSEIKNRIPYIPRKETILRTMTLLFVSGFYTLLIGIVFMSFTAPSILVRTDWLKEMYNALENPAYKNVTTANWHMESNGVVTRLMEHRMISERNNTIHHKRLSGRIQARDQLYRPVNDYSFEYLYTRSSVPNETMRSMHFNNLTQLRSKKFPWHKMQYNFKVLFIHIYVFPGMLLLRSILVLFLGIFIQYAFVDHPITEPL